MTLVVFTLAVLGALNLTSTVTGFVTAAFREGVDGWRQMRRIDRQDRWDDHVADALRVATMRRT